MAKFNANWKDLEHFDSEKGYKCVIILEKVLQCRENTDIMQTVMIPGRSIFA